MHYRQLHHIFRTSEQKSIWIFSYGNFAGGILGLLGGHLLAQWLLFLPAFVTYALGVGCGIALTFRYHGWPLYSQLYRWMRYGLHHQLRPQAYEIHSTTYYQPPVLAETTPLLMPRVTAELRPPIARGPALSQGDTPPRFNEGQPDSPLGHRPPLPPLTPRSGRARVRETVR